MRRLVAVLLCAAFMTGCAYRAEIGTPGELKPGHALIVLGIKDVSPGGSRSIGAGFENIWSNEKDNRFSARSGMKLYSVAPGTYRLVSSLDFATDTSFWEDDLNRHIVFKVEPGDAVYVGTLAYRFSGTRSVPNFTYIYTPSGMMPMYNPTTAPARFSIAVADEYEAAEAAYKGVAGPDPRPLAKKLAHHEFIPCLPSQGDGRSTVRFPKGAPSYEQRCPGGKPAENDPRIRVVGP